MPVSPCCNALLQRIRSSFLTCRVRISSRENVFLRNKSKSATDVALHENDENLDPYAPIRFSSSRAAQWKAQYKTIINDPESLEDKDETFRYLVHGVSLMVLFYYALVRGKNEWDDEMAMPLGKRMLELREYQARNELKVAVANKEDTSDIKHQLENIAKLRKEYHYD